MAPKKTNAKTSDWKSELLAGGDVVRELFREVLQEVLEAEMTETLQAKPGERTAERQGLRSGYYSRTLITRVGKLELRVPQDRQGRFSTQLFERYQRSEKALVSALAEMYVQGVSTRKVKRSPRSCAVTRSARARSVTSTKRSTSNWRSLPRVAWMRSTRI
jgi:transposase-like protein